MAAVVEINISNQIRVIISNGHDDPSLANVVQNICKYSKTVLQDTGAIPYKFHMCTGTTTIANSITQINSWEHKVLACSEWLTSSYPSGTAWISFKKGLVTGFTAIATGVNETWISEA